MGHRAQLLAFGILLAPMGAHAQDLPSSPGLTNVEKRPSDNTQTSPKSVTKSGQNENAIDWPQLLSGSGSSTTVNGGIGEGNKSKSLKELSPANASTVPEDQFRFGGTYFDLRAEKSVKPLEELRPSRCQDDDECADYSGLPKSEPPRTKGALKGIRKPYFGLSIVTPIE